MSFIDKIPDDKIRAFAEAQFEKNERQREAISALQSEVSTLKKRLGIQSDGFEDTPSLNVIYFDRDGRPCCEEHGAMNCFKHQIYRCIMCGVAIRMDENWETFRTSEARKKLSA